MIEIDGSYGEGGGQILRSAIAFSALTRKAVHISNIRVKRKNPGLQTQHIEAIKAVGKLCNAEMEGVELNSKEVFFKPKSIEGGKINVKIATAGSVCLVLQALMLPALHAKKEVHAQIKGGGTFGKWAPSIYYLKHVLNQLLKKMNYEVDVEIKKQGFYPKGGADVNVRMKPCKLKPIKMLEKGEIVSIKGISTATKNLKEKQVAERQMKSARDSIYEHFKISPEIEIEYVDSLSTGSGIQLWIETENSIISGDALGELGKKAEYVGKEAADELSWEYENGVVDKHTGDQLIPYLALSGGAIKVSEITQHCKTNMWVVERFLNKQFRIEDNTILV